MRDETDETVYTLPSHPALLDHVHVRVLVAAHVPTTLDAPPVARAVVVVKDERQVVVVVGGAAGGVTSEGPL